MENKEYIKKKIKYHENTIKFLVSKSENRPKLFQYTIARHQRDIEKLKKELLE